MAPERSVLGRIEAGASAVGGVVILASAGLVVASVLSRRLLGSPITIAFEGSEIALFVITVLVAPAVARRDGHVRMELVDTYVSGRTLARLSVGGSLVSAVACLVLAGAGAVVAVQSLEAGRRIAGVLGLPRWPLFALLATFMFLLSIEHARALVRTVRTHRRVAADGDTSAGSDV